jgi:hypothetical protein
METRSQKRQTGGVLIWIADDAVIIKKQQQQNSQPVYTMTSNGRHYPNLTPCRVVLRSSTSSLKPPVRLPQECLDTVENTVIPPPYDFALGTFTSVLVKLVVCRVTAVRDGLVLLVLYSM